MIVGDNPEMDSTEGSGVGDAQDWGQRQTAEWTELRAQFAIGRQIRRTADPSMRLGKDGKHLVPDEQVRPTLAEHATHAYHHGFPPEYLIWRGVGVSFEHGQAAHASRVASRLLADVPGFHAVLVAEHREYRIPLTLLRPDNSGTFAHQVFSAVSGGLDEAALMVAQEENIQQWEERTNRADRPAIAPDAASRSSAEDTDSTWEDHARQSDRHKRRFIEQITGEPPAGTDPAGPMSEPLSQGERESFAVASFAARLAALGFPVNLKRSINEQQLRGESAPPPHPPGRPGQTPER